MYSIHETPNVQLHLFATAVTSSRLEASSFQHIVSIVWKCQEMVGGITPISIERL